jgi:hypothetical protein
LIFASPAPPAAALSGTSTTPVVPRMPSVEVGVVIVMSPVFATRLATKAIVPRAQRRLVVEVHAERRVDAGLQHVILVNSVTHFQCRSRRLAACHCRAALQGCDLTDGIVALACSCIFVGVDAKNSRRFIAIPRLPDGIVAVPTWSLEAAKASSRLRQNHCLQGRRQAQTSNRLTCESFHVFSLRYGKAKWQHPPTKGSRRL